MSSGKSSINSQRTSSSRRFLGRLHIPHFLNTHSSLGLNLSVPETARETHKVSVMHLDNMYNICIIMHILLHIRKRGKP